MVSKIIFIIIVIDTFGIIKNPEIKLQKRKLLLLKKGDEKINEYIDKHKTPKNYSTFILQIFSYFDYSNMAHICSN